MADTALVETSQNTAGVTSAYATVLAGGQSMSFVSVRATVLGSYFYSPLLLEGWVADNEFGTVFYANYGISTPGATNFGIVHKSRGGGALINTNFTGSVEFCNRIFKGDGLLINCDFQVKTPYTGTASEGLFYLESDGTTFPQARGCRINVLDTTNPTRPAIQTAAGNQGGILNCDVLLYGNQFVDCASAQIDGTTIRSTLLAPTINAAAGSAYELQTTFGTTFAGQQLKIAGPGTSAVFYEDTTQVANSKLMSISNSSQQLFLRGLNDDGTVAQTIATFHRGGLAAFGGLFTGFNGVSFWSDLSMAGTTTGAGATTRQQGGIAHAWGANSIEGSQRGRVTFNVYDTAARAGVRLDATGAAANVGLAGGSDYGGGAGVVAIPNATGVPNANPVGGGVLYVEGGALKFRGSSGTVTTIANP